MLGGGGGDGGIAIGEDVRVPDAVFCGQWLCLDFWETKRRKRFFLHWRRHGRGDIVVSNSSKCGWHCIFVELILGIISITIGVVVGRRARLVADGWTHCQRARGRHLGGAAGIVGMWHDHNFDGCGDLSGSGDDGAVLRRCCCLGGGGGGSGGGTDDAGTADLLAAMPLVLYTVGSTARKLGRDLGPPV